MCVCVYACMCVCVCVCVCVCAYMPAQRHDTSGLARVIALARRRHVHCRVRRVELRDALRVRLAGRPRERGREYVHGLVELQKPVMDVGAGQIVGLGAAVVGLPPECIEVALELAAQWRKRDDGIKVLVLAVVDENLCAAARRARGGHVTHRACHLADPHSARCGPARTTARSAGADRRRMHAGASCLRARGPGRRCSCP